MTVITIRPEDVSAYGSSAAIVLSVLRSQGCSQSTPLLVQYAALGRLCGLDYRAVSRALARLRKRRAISVGSYRHARALMVRTRHGATVPATTDATPQNVTTQVDAEVVVQDSPSLRLDSVRSLLDAVG